MKLIITEKQEKKLANILNEGMFMEPSPQNPSMKKANKPYCINPDKVLIVKNFLDNGFQKGSMENIGNNGLPQKVNIVAMLSSNGDVLRNMTMTEMNDMLIDKFKNMFSDHDERSLFMKQVLKDWFNDKIGTFGSLSVNHL